MSRGLKLYFQNTKIVFLSLKIVLSLKQSIFGISSESSLFAKVPFPVHKLSIVKKKNHTLSKSCQLLMPQLNAVVIIIISRFKILSTAT